jgi:hypothetical protein
MERVYFGDIFVLNRWLLIGCIVQITDDIYFPAVNQLSHQFDPS